MSRAVNSYFLLSLFTLGLCVLNYIWFAASGNGLLGAEDLKGQKLYILSKFAGMNALYFIAWQIILGLALPFLFKRIFLLHPLIAILVIILSVTHCLLFISAVSIRQGYIAWGLALPNFNDYYHTFIAAGIFGFVLLIVVAWAGALRSKRQNNKKYKILHKLYIAVIVLTYLHSMSIGSDSQHYASQIVYYSLALIIFLLLIFRIISGDTTNKKAIGREVKYS